MVTHLAKRQYFTKVDDAFEVVFECTIYPPEQVSEQECVCSFEICRKGQKVKRGKARGDGLNVLAGSLVLCLHEETKFLATFSGPLFKFGSPDEEVSLGDRKFDAMLAMNRLRRMMNVMQQSIDALLAAHPFLEGEPVDGYWTEE